MHETAAIALSLPMRLRQMRKPLSARQAAGELGEHYVTFIKACGEGKRPHTRIDGRIVVDPVDLAKWWEARTIMPR